MPAQLFLKLPEMPMQALALLAGPVVLYHAGAVQGHQHIIAKGLMHLPVRHMGRIYGPHLAPFPQGEVGAFHRLPPLLQHQPAALGCAGKQVHFKVLHRLFPAHPVAALPAVLEHFPVRKNLFHRAKPLTPLLPICRTFCPAALVTRLPALLTGHNYSLLRADVL